MRLKPLFLTLAAFAPLSFTPALGHDGHGKEIPHTETAPHSEAVAHDESVPHVHQKSKTPQNETPIDYFWRKSDEAFHAGDYPRAVGLHRAIVALDPTEIESYSLGAWLLWSLGKSDDALKFLDEGLKANPQAPEMWDAAGQQYDLQKRFADSENAFGKAVELAGKEAPQMLRRRYAHATEHAGNWAKSVEVWRALVADFPGEAVNRNNLARVEKESAEAQKGKLPAVAAVGAAALLGVFALVPLKKKNRGS